MSRLEDARTQSLKGYARKMEMDFHEEDEFGLMRLLQSFSLFKRGRRRKITNIMYKEIINHKSFVFDYTYVIGKNNHRKYKRQTVLFVDSKDLGLPAFSMQPEFLWHRLTEWLRLTKDIDFETHPEFSEKYLLQAEDEALLRYLYNKEVLDFFTIQKNWYVEGLNYFLLIYSLNERFHPKVIESFIEMGNRLFDLLKQDPKSISLDHPL